MKNDVQITLNPEMLRVKIQDVSDKISATIAILDQLQNKFIIKGGCDENCYKNNRSL